MFIFRMGIFKRVTHSFII